MVIDVPLCRRIHPLTIAPLSAAYLLLSAFIWAMITRFAIRYKQTDIVQQYGIDGDSLSRARDDIDAMTTELRQQQASLGDRLQDGVEASEESAQLARFESGQAANRQTPTV